MSIKQIAFLSVAVILVGSLAWAEPDGPSPRCDPSAAMQFPATSSLVQKALSELWPDASLRLVEGSGNSVVITGNVKTAETVTQVMDFASIFFPNVVNGITVGVEPQIQLQVLIAEVDCGKLDLQDFQLKRACEFGFKSSTAVDTANANHNAAVSTELQLNQGSRLSLATTTDADDLRAWIRELKTQGSAKIIAQPTLITVSGRTAAFIIGGQCPIVVPMENGDSKVETRDYGFQLECKPIHIGDGRIRLEMKIEHTSLDYANGVEVPDQTVPGVISRRIHTSADVATTETLVVSGLHCPLKCCTNCKPEQPREVIALVNYKLVKPAGAAEGKDQYSTLLPAVTYTEKADGEIKVIHGRSRTMHCLDPIVRTHVADSDVVDVVQFSAKEIAFVGRNRGATKVTLWRNGEQAPLCLLVKVINDPEAGDDGKQDLGKLEVHINEMFTKAHVKLIPVAQRIVVTGEASDAAEASQILAIVRHHETLCANESSRACQSASGCMVFPQPVPSMCSSVVNMLKTPPTVQVVATEIESDADQPHAPAILLTPADGDPIREDPKHDSRVRLAQVRVHESPTNKQLFGVGVSGDAGLLGEIVEADVIRQLKLCPHVGGAEGSHCQNCHGKCCEKVVELQRVDSDDCDEDEDDSIESFIEQVLHAQIQHLEGMMHSRLAHERELLAAKSAADSAIAKLKAGHADEILRLRLDHVAEMQNLKETVWAMERRSLELQHQQALEHERHLAELRIQHADEMQAQRIVTLQAQIRHLQEEDDANCPECKPFADFKATETHEASHASHPEELPVLVEDLTSGRVHYSPVPPKPHVAVRSQPVHDSVERVEFSTPPLTTNHFGTSEIERLRREVARLRSLVEDLLCIAPDSPPAPKPHVPDDEE